MAPDVEKPLEVRRHPTFPGFQKVLGLIAVTVAAALFVAAGITAPTSAYGVLFLAVGGLGTIYCAVIALRAGGTLLSKRPTLVLDPDGVRVLRAWPFAPGDRHLPWSELATVCAWSQGPPTGGRGAGLNQLYLSFLPRRPDDTPRDDAPREVESGAELLATKVAEIPCVPTLRYTLPVRPGWDATIDQIIATAAAYAPQAPFTDRRELPKPRRKRRPPTPRTTPSTRPPQDH